MTALFLLAWGSLVARIGWVTRRKWRDPTFAAAYFVTFWALLLVAVEALSAVRVLTQFSLRLGLLAAVPLAYLVVRDLAPIRAEAATRTLRVSLAVVAVFVVAALIAGTRTAPNNWDSLTYHLPRIQHWLANRSVSHYATIIDRQNWESPLGDYQSMFAFAATGTDRFDFLPSTFAFLTCVLAGLSVCRRLGVGGQVVFLTPLLLLSPSTVTQMATTQTDLRAAAFVLTAPALWLAPGARVKALAGVSLGLAFATKPSSLIAAVPFLLLPEVVREFRSLRRRSFMIISSGVAVALAVNAPWLLRNRADYGSFGGPGASLVGFPSGPRSALIALIRTLDLNLAIPGDLNWNSHLAQLTGRWVWALWQGRDFTLLPYGGAWAPLRLGFDEDVASNPALIVALLIVFAVGLWSRGRYRAILAVAPLLLGALFIQWQPWLNRLLVSALAACAILLTLAVAQLDPDRVRRVVVGGVAVVAAGGVLLSALQVWNSDRRGLWNVLERPSPRTSQYFVAWPSLQFDYDTVAAYLRRTGVKVVAVRGGPDSWEYPLWVMNPIVRFQYGLADAGAVVCLSSCSTSLPSGATVLLALPSGVVLALPPAGSRT